MALPNINEHQKFELNLPSTGQLLHYRPYLVKEEKVLMMAMESQNMNLILESVADTIVACIDEEVDKRKLTPYDVEYTFVKLRAKSVGEVAPVNIRCKKCDELNPVNVDLDAIRVVKSDKEVSNKIDLGNDMSIELRHPSYMDIAGVVENENVESAFATMSRCLSVLHTKDTRFDLADESKESIMKLLDQMTGKQLEQLKNYIASAPKVLINTVFDCSKCSEHNDIDLEGMKSFF